MFYDAIGARCRGTEKSLGIRKFFLLSQQSELETGEGVEMMEFSRVILASFYPGVSFFSHRLHNSCFFPVSILLLSLDMRVS